MKEKNKQKTVLLGIVSALLASLCCITPVLAVLAGLSGIASLSTWMEPLRPYFLVLTILILALAWYQKLKPRKKDEISCECETEEKPSFWQSKKFLIIVTVLAALLLAFPYYSGIFFDKRPGDILMVDKANVTHATITIEGMTCTGCEKSINKAVKDIPGVIKVDSDYTTGIAHVEYDKSRVDDGDFTKAIEQRVGYKILSIEKE